MSEGGDPVAMLGHEGQHSLHTLAAKRRESGMSKVGGNQGLTMEVCATYFIQVQGNLDVSWADRLAGMQIRARWNDGQTAVTTLIGPLADQAALLGVLNTLYDLHLPLLSVERLLAEESVLH